jgi:hypothetical protein
MADTLDAKVKAWELSWVPLRVPLPGRGAGPAPQWHNHAVPQDEGDRALRGGTRRADTFEMGTLYNFELGVQSWLSRCDEPRLAARRSVHARCLLPVSQGRVE